MKSNILLSLKSVGLLLFLGLTSFNSSADNYFVKRGDKMMARLQYMRAVENYRLAYKMNHDAGLLAKIGTCFYNSAQFDSAFNYYKQLKKAYVNDTTILYNYSAILLTKGRYMEARKVLKDYLTQKRATARIRVLLKSCDAPTTLPDHSNVVTVENLNLNSANDEFSPYIRGEYMYFVASSRDSRGGIYRYDDKPFLEIYKSKRDISSSFQSPEMLPTSINSRLHEGPFTFDPNNGKMYFTRNTPRKAKEVKGFVKGLYNLKIYTADSGSDGTYTAPEPFPFNSEQYSVGHPTISPNGKYLVFTSDNPEGNRGEKDLFISKRDGETWGAPEPMARNINTQCTEMFPFFASDTLLIFSSDGLVGFGGLDMYKVTFSNGVTGIPVNMGRPYNSPRDDFGYYKSLENPHEGFFSSNRVGGKGGDDIYRFRNVEVNVIVMVSDSLTEKPIEAAGLRFACMDNPPGDLSSNHEGEITYRLTTADRHCITISKPGYRSRTVMLAPNGQEGDKDTTIFVKLLQGREDELANFTKRRAIKISNIYYDFDKYDIRADAVPILDSLFDVLIDNPQTILEIHSHTDSRGTFDYNIELSRERAESVIAYMVDHGIDKSRILHIYHGETRMSTPCPDGTPCSEQAHQLNRRSEFKVYDMWAGVIGD